MRVFILVALLAMAATVSCQDISPACNATSNALDVASVNDAEKAITKGGCTKVNFDITSNQCNYDNATTTYSCLCTTTLTNTAAWETAVRNISNGRPCYLDITFTLTGTLKVDNTTTRTITINATQTNAETIAVGGNCTNTEIEAGLAKAVQEGVSVLADTQSPLNANSASTGVTWTTGTATVSGCGVSKKSATTNIPAAAAGTTTAPTTQAPTTPSGTTAPPTSTGKNGASIIASSVALVASLIAAVTILA